MQTFSPSKTLNIKSNFFGLTLDDLLCLMVFYTVFQLLFALIGLEIVSLILTFLTAFLLIPVRLKYRQGNYKRFFILFLHKVIKGNLFH